MLPRRTYNIRAIILFNTQNLQLVEFARYHNRNSCRILERPLGFMANLCNWFSDMPLAIWSKQLKNGGSIYFLRLKVMIFISVTLYITEQSRFFYFVLALSNDNISITRKVIKLLWKYATTTITDKNVNLQPF